MHGKMHLICSVAALCLDPLGEELSTLKTPALGDREWALKKRQKRDEKELRERERHHSPP